MTSKPDLQLCWAHGVQLEPRACLAAAADGAVVLAAGASALLRADAAGGLESLPLPGGNKALGCVAYSEPARCLAAGESGFKPAVFVLFDGQAGAPLALRGHNFGIQAVAFSPSGAPCCLIAWFVTAVCSTIAAAAVAAAPT